MAKHLAGRLALSLISVLVSTYRVVDVKNPRLCRVADRRELHAPGSDRSCLHVELEIPETMMYVPCGGESCLPLHLCACASDAITKHVQL